MSASINCPFCGGNAAIDTLNYANGKPAKYRAQCQKCQASTAWYSTAGEAWNAWNRREAGCAAIAFNKDAFILNGLAYFRNPSTGYCTAQKEFRGKLLRIKEEVFNEAYEECVKIAGAEA